MNYIDELKALAAGELLCATQYKMAAEAIVGPGENYSYIQEHCAEHYEEEMDHYSALVGEIMKAEAAPLKQIKSIIKYANPELEELKSYKAEDIREFFQKAEQNAIEAYVDFYKEICDDPELMDIADLITEIISEEKEHELDFRKILEAQEEKEPVIDDPIKESTRRYLLDF